MRSHFIALTLGLLISTAFACDDKPTPPAVPSVKAPTAVPAAPMEDTKSASVIDATLLDNSSWACSMTIKRSGVEVDVVTKDTYYKGGRTTSTADFTIARAGDVFPLMGADSSAVAMTLGHDMTYTWRVEGDQLVTLDVKAVASRNGLRRQVILKETRQSLDILMGSDKAYDTSKNKALLKQLKQVQDNTERTMLAVYEQPIPPAKILSLTKDKMLMVAEGVSVACNAVPGDINPEGFQEAKTKLGL